MTKAKKLESVESAEITLNEQCSIKENSYLFIYIPYFLVYFPPLNIFLSLTMVRKLFKFAFHKRKINAETRGCHEKK